MANLYLDGAGSEVRRDGDTLVIRQNGIIKQRVPLRLVERAVVRGDVLLHAGALTGLSLHGASLLVLPRRHSSGTALLSRGCGPDAARRLSQYEACGNPAMAMPVAAYLVRARLRGSARLLFRAARLRPELGKQLNDGIVRLTALEREVAAQQRILLARLMGLEGAGAAAFFTAYRSLFAPALGFTQRNRRPPKDPVNASLSLAYTLLHAEAVSAILTAGLDPSLGFLHQPAHGRESLACDLVETLRSRAEEWVWDLFRTQKLRAAHFRDVQGGCLLGKAGRRIFYEAFEPLRQSSGQRLHSVLARLVRTLKLGEPSGPYLTEAIGDGSTSQSPPPISGSKETVWQ